MKVFILIKNAALFVRAKTNVQIFARLCRYLDTNDSEYNFCNNS